MGQRRYNQGVVNEGGPGVKYRSVTPDDNNDLPGGFARAFWVGGLGDIVIVDITDHEEVFPIPYNGYILALGSARVKSTGTTATDIKAIYE